jgi:fatty acid-binding protein DegV
MRSDIQSPRHVTLRALLDTIVEKIKEYQKHTHLAFSLECIRNLANNGRVNPAIAKIIGILGIRLVGKASNKGELEMTDKTRGSEKALGDVFKNTVTADILHYQMIMVVDYRKIPGILFVKLNAQRTF